MENDRRHNIEFTDAQKEWLEDILTRSHAAVTKTNSDLYRDFINKLDEHAEEEAVRFNQYTKTADANAERINKMEPTVAVMKDALTTLSTVQKVSIWIATFIAGLIAWKKLT